MVERLGVGPFVVESPAGLLVPDKRIIRERDLLSIFGVDVKALAKSKLIELGIFAENQELTFLDPPNAHSYKREDGIVVKSGAQYFFEEIVGDHEIKISYMPHFEKSSEHLHTPPINEEYHLIAGCAKVKIGEEIVDLNEARKFLEVPPFMQHQLMTDLAPAFVLIAMKNAALVPKEKWHKFA